MITQSDSVRQRVENVNPTWQLAWGQIYWSSLWRLVLGFVCVGIALSQPALASRPWQPQDSVSVKYVTQDAARTSFDPKVSPDGRYLFFVTHWGEIESDASFCELYVYEVSQLRKQSATYGQEKITPTRRVVLRSVSSMFPAIDQAAWETDGQAVLFLAMTPEDTQELYRLDIDSGALDRLTQGGYRHPNRIDGFVATRGGVLYKDSVLGEIPATAYPGKLVERQRNGGMSLEMSLARAGGRALYASYQRKPAREVRLLLPSGVQTSWQLNDSSRLWLAPDGKNAVGLIVKTGGEARQDSFVRVDLEQARQVSIPDFHVPVGTGKRRVAAAVFGSSEVGRVILVNTTAPSDSTSKVGAESGYIVEYDVASGRWKILEALEGAAGTAGEAALRVGSVGWLKSGEELLVTHTRGGQPAEGTVYRFAPSGVTARTVAASMRVPPAATLDGLSVQLRQSPNDPPKVVAANGARETVLWDSNSQLQPVTLARTEPFSWQEPDGRRVTGALTLPPNYREGQRVPLVIQMNAYDKVSFSPDGLVPSSDMPQSLAARGIAALTIDLPFESTPGALRFKADSPGEGVATVTRLEAVVDTLVRAGRVDPQRVAVTGFSHGGYNSLYAITHPGRVRFAAAVAADSFIGTYGWYLQVAGAGDPNRLLYEHGRGGSLWQQPAAWLREDPTFNVDRVVTPFLATRHGNGQGGFRIWQEDKGRDQTTQLELQGAFGYNGKPLEYLYLPESNHSPGRPLEYLALMDATLDWLSFWLQGYEDPSPHKSAQYVRWRPMRELQKQSRTQAVARESQSDHSGQ